MNADDMRSQFAYDRWATRQVLAQLEGIDAGELDLIVYLEDVVPTLGQPAAASVEA